MANYDTIRTVKFVLETEHNLAGFTALSKELNKADQEIRKLTRELEALTEANKQDTQEYKDKNARLQQLTGNLKELIRAEGEYLQGLKLEQYSLKQLKVIRKQLLDQVSWAQADTEHFRKAAAQLNAVNARMRELKTLAGEAGNSFMGMGKFTGGITKLFAAFGIGAGALSLVANRLREVWGTLKDVSESFSDIRKVTSLSISDTYRLTSRLSRLDTRTSITDRMQLAVIGGRMGIDGVSQLTDFARAVDKIVVSLGDSLKGSSEEIITKLAKIVNSFDTATRESITFSEAMERTGSALNQVAAEGVASEEWQVDFLFRTGAIGRSLNIAMQKMLGFGAVLEETGNTQEVAGTAISQFFGEVAKNVELYAQRAQMPVEKFVHLLETDANEAIIAVLESIKKGTVSNTELVRTFSDLGIDGERATKVILSLANNTDKLREKQALANEAFDKNVSLTQEYEKRQVSLLGAIQRIGNSIQQWFVNTGLERWLKGIFNGIADIIAIKPSEELAKERVQLSLTEAKLRDTNIAWEDKLALLKELQADYPGLFQNIQTEADLYSSLADNMERANAALTQKIAMQKNEEELSDYVEKQQDISSGIQSNLEKAYSLINDLRDSLSEGLKNQLPEFYGVSSSSLREYIQQLKPLVLEQKNIDNPELLPNASKKGLAFIRTAFSNPIKNFPGISGSGISYTNKLSQLEAIVSNISYQEDEIKKSQTEINEILSTQAKRQEIIDNIISGQSTNTSAPALTRQDYLETMRSVASGGTSYLVYDPDTESFVASGEIAQEALDQIRATLDLQQRVIDRSVSLSDPRTAAQLQQDFLAHPEFKTYDEYLRTTGTTLGMAPEQDTTAQAEAAKKAADLRSRREKMFTDTRKWLDDQIASFSTSDLPDFQAQREKLEKELLQGLEKYRNQIFDLYEGTPPAEVVDEIETNLEQLREGVGLVLDLQDRLQRIDLDKKVFDLTATDEQKAFRALDDKYAPSIRSAEYARDTSSTLPAREHYQALVDSLRAAYDQEYAALVEKYKPEDQKRSEAKSRQVYNAQLAYDGVSLDTSQETDQAQQINDLMYQLYGDNWQRIYQAHQEFLQSDYDSELEFLKDRVQAHKKAEQEIAEFKRSLADTTISAISQVSGAAISLELERNTNAMDQELERYEGNERKQDEIRRKYARKEAAIKSKQAVLDYLTGLAAVIAKSWGQGGIFGGVLAGIQAAAYTATLAIQLQQIQAAASAFAAGKYDTIRTRDGRRYTARVRDDANRTRFVSEPTYFARQNALVGEQMPEIIISGPDTQLLRRLRPDIIEDIASLPGAQGFAQGRYAGASSPTVPAPVSPSRAQNTDRRTIRVLERLESILSAGIMANVLPSEDNMLPLQKGLNRLKKRQDQSKKF